MWSISNLKNRGKVAFKRNYWKSVLVCLLLSIIVGGFASSGASNSAAEETTSQSSDFEYVPGNRYEGGEGSFYFDESTGEFSYDIGNDFPGDVQDALPDSGSSSSIFSNMLDGSLMAMAAGTVFIIVIVAIVIAIIIDIFLYNP
ncbi:MAG: hypothetical protein K5675_05370, partial [Lachnospiraceae bacterium]|nr:hypothetical protein [Lachnospiraceae bacterium]